VNITLPQLEGLDVAASPLNWAVENSSKLKIYLLTGFKNVSVFVHKNTVRSKVTLFSELSKDQKSSTLNIMGQESMRIMYRSVDGKQSPPFASLANVCKEWE
jgi:hypothetical protein